METENMNPNQNITDTDAKTEINAEPVVGIKPENSSEPAAETVTEVKTESAVEKPIPPRHEELTFYEEHQELFIQKELPVNIVDDNKPNYIKRMVLCGIYAIFFTFCMYKTHTGITYPLFAAATIGAYVISLKALKEKIKGFSIMIMGLIMLLAINVFTTMSAPLIIFDKIFIFALFFVLFLNTLYDDKTWDTTRFVGAALSMITTSFRYIIDPVADFVRIKKSSNDEKGKKKLGNVKYVLLGLVITIPILAVVLPLLASSDAVFANLLRNTFSFEINSDVIWIFILTILIFFVGYALLKRFYVKMGWLQRPVSDKRNGNPAVAITISSVLLVIYAIYSGIQIIFLFLGFGTLPEGYTYADYAHEGFFQLVFVCLINLVLVLICRKYSKDNSVLKIMLTCICICTYVMLASSAYRMILYISVYGLTFLRVYVLWALTVIALAMAGTITLIYKANMPFVKYSIVVIAATWAVFGFAHPDRIIAAHNLTRHTGEIYVISDLSADAVPVIVQYENSLDKYDQKQFRWYWKNSRYFRKENDIRKFNLSVYQGRKAVKNSAVLNASDDE